MAHNHLQSSGPRKCSTSTKHLNIFGKDEGQNTSLNRERVNATKPKYEKVLVYCKN